ncbi:hypothetical protein LCGC14_1426050 [marine sediment metagenome]|uniref:Uncharacterized protein n=1 Tax=marine sediment metagenome TaxID=412755 RepID=A0A0F9KB26_9ZZZZ
MNVILIGQDVNDIPIQKGDKVFADDGWVQGVITAVYDDGTVDIWHANAHQGPVVDTFDVKSNNVLKKQIDTGD